MPIDVKVVRRVSDARGWLFEPLDANEFATQKNIHVTLTKPGHLRGNHVHRHATEIVTVCGPARVRVREVGADTDSDYDVPEGEAHRFTFAPGVAHAILNTGPGMGLAIAFTDRLHDPSAPDTMRVVLIDAPNAS